MRRALLVGIVVALGGCASMELVGLPMVPMAGVMASKHPDLQLSLMAGKAGGDGPVEGGWTTDVRFVGGGGEGVGLLSYGRIEAGAYGRDRLMALVDAEIGVGVAMPRVHVGLLTGWAYGGYTQNGQMFPVRAMAMFETGAVALRVSGYVAHRFSTPGEWPAVSGTFNAHGAEVYALAGKVARGGLGLGVSYDQADGVSTVSFRFGFGAFGAPQ